MGQIYGLFFIFIAIMSYVPAVITSVLISIKHGSLDLSIFHSLLLQHILFAIGLYMSRDIFKQLKYDFKSLMTEAVYSSARSLQLLLMFNVIFLFVGLMQGRSLSNPRTVYDILHTLTYLSLFLHFRKKGLS